MMDDLISRKDAIDAFERELSAKYNRIEMAIGFVGVKSILQGLPSAQPEIIRCKDCKYCDRGIDEDGNPFLKCLGWAYGGTQEEDFCSHAERRTDE